MNVLADLVGGPAQLARKSNLSRRVIDKYRTGASDPSRARLIALAAAGGVSILWLATGEGPMRPSATPDKAALLKHELDQELLFLVIDAVHQAYREESARLPARPAAGVISEIYNSLVAAYDSVEECKIGLKGLIAKLRRELRGAQPSEDGTGKRSA
jgi:transcriptional regulator with XRE-family HTH domain